MGSQGGRRIRLIDLVRGEVGDVDVGFELGPERSLDLSELIKDDASEEGMRFNLVRTAMSEALGDVAYETVDQIRTCSIR